MSGRSQAVSYLASSKYFWDAEIILRVFYEANAKIWLVCFVNEDERQGLAEEFWGDYSQMHNHKKAHRAGAAAEFLKRRGQKQNAEVIATLKNPAVFQFGSANKKTRKALEQKWSFTEIVKLLSKLPAKNQKLKDAPVLFHMYGQQSHLIHADDAALDLVLDRNLRSTEEKAALEASHLARIYSDQSSLWTLSAMALQFRYNQEPEDQNELEAKMEIIRKLAKPILVRFNETQEEFYQGINREDQSDLKSR